MSANVEDLYLKGFMAFTSKEYAKAKAFWEQVLKQDPNHEKARKGLMELQQTLSSSGASRSGASMSGSRSGASMSGARSGVSMSGASHSGTPNPLAGETKKRTSKEILQEIKRLYGAKQYLEARGLCELLLRKHPNNKDLRGLFQKIDARCKAGGKPSAPPVQQRKPSETSSPDLESTMYYTSQAEAYMDQHDGAAAGAPEVDVDKLIQQGVQLYEVQDYDRALQAWQKALDADPENRIVKDYIQNVRAMMAEESGGPEPAPEPPAAPSADAGLPSKEALLQAYNDGLRLYEERHYPQAMEKWNFILKFHPNHRETLQCLEKTKAAIGLQEKHASELERAKQELLGGNHEEAEDIVARLATEVPDLDGLDAVRKSIENRKRQINEIRSLELETNEGQEKPVATKTSDEEITKFFTPDTGEGTGEARQVTRIIQTGQEKKPVSKFLLIGVPIILIGIAFGTYFGYRYVNQMSIPEEKDEEVYIPTTSEVNWNGARQKCEDFLLFGKEYYDSQNFAFSILSFSRVVEVATPRVAEIRSIELGKRTFELKDELDRLTELMSEAKLGLRQSESKLVADESVGEKELKRAETDVRRGNLSPAIETYSAALTQNLEDPALREQLGSILEQMAFKKLEEDQPDEAMTLFKQSTVVKPAFEMPRRHMEVIKRFFNGKITAVEKDQWFFFFINA
ncbi:Tetratricopeptide repeat protein [Sulfidibacter corallicola]|uniref:Tetratricopeptide repeat protein n=1 Tax=Sulfidibacter corallicola TaxID=2818388 RepID=A0A8A4TD85_SULCO|nr:hypothetical protein [Sulfidibacter corallicola]QTD47537.1 hypothetical protein J3U87_18235 [Sulfidibacter corallicola]